MADNNSRTLTANFTADTNGFSPKINDLVQKLKSASQEFEQNKTKISALKTEMKTYQKELEQLNAKQHSNGSLTVEEQRRMQELRERIAACATQLGTYNSAQRQLSSNMNSLNRQLSEARDEFNGTGQAAATFGDVLKANIASDVVMSGIRKLISGLRQAAAYCYDVGSRFEAGMSKVAAISGASADDLERLTEKAKDLGASTKFTASETAEAMNYMAMAGWKTEEMLSGIDGVLGLAAASGTDLATTSDIVTDALTAFGLKAEDCAHFADILAAASSNANTNVSMMGETFKYCAPIAGALGFKAEDVAVGIGLMANAGVKATNAGTAMRKFMTELSEGLTITGEKIGEVTIRTANADGSMRSYAEILGELRGVFSQLTDSEKSAAAKDIVGQNALSGFLAMMNASEDDVQKLTLAIRNCDGAASAMADTMEQNVQGAVTKMNSALEGVGVAVYDKFKDGLLDAVNIFTETLGDLKTDIDGGELDASISNLADSFRKLATEGANVVKNTLPGFVDGFANVLTFISTFHTEIGSAIASFIAFKTAMNVTSAVVNIANAFKTVTTAIKGATTAQEVFNAVLKGGNPVLFTISAAIAAVTFAVSEFAWNTNSASASVEELRQKSEELAQSAQNYKQKADDLSEIKKQYEEIEKSLDPDVEKSKNLKELQDQLIQQFPELAGQIDLATGSYDEMANAIQRVVDGNSERALADFKQSKAKMEELQRQGISVDLGYIGDDLRDWLPESGLNYEIGHGNNITFKGTFEEQAQALEKLNGYYESIGKIGSMAMDNINEKWREADENAKKYQSTLNGIDEIESQKSDDKSADSGGSSQSSDYYKMQYGDTSSERNQKTEEELEQNKALYDKEKQLKDDLYSVGRLNEEEYYAELTRLRDEYLEEETHDWFVATAQIKSYQDKNLKDQKSALSETELAYKKTLAAIDAEIERHNRAKSDKEYERQLAEIDDQLEYGRLDELSKLELEKARKKLVEDHDEELYKRNADDAKSAVTDAYNAQQTLEKASENTKEYTMALGDYTDALESLSGILKGVSDAFTVSAGGSSSVTNLDESTQNQYVNVVLQAVNKSNGQIVDELIKALYSRLG